MDKIYSRTKLKLPIMKAIKTKNKKIRKIYFTVILLTISILTVNKVLNAVDPIFEGLCIKKAESIATDITNRKSSDVLLRYDYQNTVQMIKGDAGNILKTDIVTINQIASDIAIEIQKELDNLSKQYIEIPLGALTGNKYLAGFGPNIKIQIISTGDIITDIKTEFKAAGINQTVYRIYLDLQCNVSILTAYKSIDTSITNQVLLVETVVVGEVPETFLNLEER